MKRLLCLAVFAIVSVMPCAADQLRSMIDQDARKIINDLPDARQADAELRAYLDSLPPQARSLIAGLFSDEATAYYLSALLGRSYEDVLASEPRLAKSNGALTAFIQGIPLGKTRSRVADIAAGVAGLYTAAGAMRANPSHASGPMLVPVPNYSAPPPMLPAYQAPTRCYGYVDPGASYVGSTCY